MPRQLQSIHKMISRSVNDVAQLKHCCLLKHPKKPNTETLEQPNGNCLSEKWRTVGLFTKTVHCTAVVQK